MASAYSIIGQRQTTQLDPTGRPIDVMEITWQTIDGDVGSLRLPLDRYAPEVVRAEVEARIADMMEVRRLGREG